MFNWQVLCLLACCVWYLPAKWFKQIEFVQHSIAASHCIFIILRDTNTWGRWTPGSPYTGEHTHTHTHTHLPRPGDRVIVTRKSMTLNK